MDFMVGLSRETTSSQRQLIRIHDFLMPYFIILFLCWQSFCVAGAGLSLPAVTASQEIPIAAKPPTGLSVSEIVSDVVGITSVEASMPTNAVDVTMPKEVAQTETPVERVVGGEIGTEEAQKTFTLTDIRLTLVKGVALYQKMANDIKHWPQFTCLNSVLKKGERDPIVTVMRKQLTYLGFMPKDHPASDLELFDETVEKGVRAFQERHSLDRDGILGLRTCRLLNMTPTNRVRLIHESIAQLDQLSAEWKGRFILVNVPTYDLFAVNQNRIEHAQSVIVGLLSRPTPNLSSPILSIVLNPSWGVPVSIFMKDKLRKVLHDPEYLERSGYRVYDQHGELLDPTVVNWDEVSRDHFPYTVRQQPGPNNALGNLKFILANDRAIFMHGTPQVSLFEKGERALSSGCIRVEDPIALALWVLNDAHMTMNLMHDMIDEETTQALPVKEKISVHTIYIPVWVDKEGILIFSSDPYHKNKI